MDFADQFVITGIQTQGGAASDNYYTLDNVIDDFIITYEYNHGIENGVWRQYNTSSGLPEVNKNNSKWFSIKTLGFYDWYTLNQEIKFPSDTFWYNSRNI